MRRHKLLLTGLAAVLAVGLVPAAAAAAPPPHAPTVSNARVLTTFPRGADGSFAESLAVDRQGVLYVGLTTWSASGWNRGQVWKVTADGRRTRFGPELAVGVLTGLAFDDHGRLYAGLAAWTDPASPPLRSGVVRIDATSATRVLSLPTAAAEVSSFPNGLAFHGDDLYVSDSVTGAVWRTRPAHRDGPAAVDVQSTPWLKTAVLAPAAKGHIGLNGIAFRAGSLYGVVADSGRLVRIDLGRHGQALAPRVVTRSASLVSADGVAFDTAGRLWVATNGGSAPRAGSLVRVEPGGRVAVLLDKAPWLDYPTQVAFGPTRHGRLTVHVTDGAFNSSGTSNVVSLQVQVGGVIR